MPEAGKVVEAIENLLRRRVGAPGSRPDVLIGLVGRGIQLSRSPAMHEREAARLGLSCAYILIDFDALDLSDDELAAAIDAAASLGFAGLNVTFPFKQSVMPLLDGVDTEAASIGAVNTVVFGQRRTGHNTDCWGYAASFRAAMGGVALDHVVLFGAGGAGSAVAYALTTLGARRISIVDPDLSRASALAARVEASETSAAAVSDPVLVLSDADGIVNTTPVGMASHPGTPFDTQLLRSSQWVSDVIYFPSETELLRQARVLDCRTLAGSGMAVGQAARAFELFTGHPADVEAMKKHFGAAA